MSKHRDSSKKALPSIPNVFKLDKYDFKDDCKLWLTALTLRFELRKEIEGFLAWNIPEDEDSEPRLALCSAVHKHLQDKVLSLMDRPIPLSGDSADQPTQENSTYAQLGVKSDQVSSFLGRSKAVRDRLVIDEVCSATKLQDEGYKNLFVLEIEKLRKKNDSILSSGLFGISPRQEFGRNHRVGETSHFMTTYSMWRADMQMPNFSGEFGLKVNLLHDDKVLISEFKEWLKATRAAAVPHFSTHKGITTATLKEWAKMQLIPYLDLWLYQQIFGVTLPFLEIGALLYDKGYNPDRLEDDGGDWTKKARDTHKRAMELTNPLSFYALHGNV